MPPGPVRLKGSEGHAEPLLVVSLHDLAPPTRSVYEPLLGRLAEEGIFRTSLLVVPRWHGRAPFAADASFVAWLRSLVDRGHEVCMHGLEHRAAGKVMGGPVQQLLGAVYTAGEGEFFQLSRKQAEDRLREGLAVFEESRLKVRGFVPPAWLISPGCIEALEETGFEYTTTLSRVILLRSRRRLRAPALALSTRAGWRRWASRRWTPLWTAWNCSAPVLRLTVHPGDLVFPGIRSMLLAAIRRAAEERRVATYCDLLDERAGEAAGACRSTM